MKANNKQKKICDYIISQANYWKNSNDITSPTHLGDIEEEANMLDDVMTDGQIEDLCDFMSWLYWLIRDFDKES